MDSEVKEVVYISISAIVLSVVLGFIAIISMVQRDIAQARNDEILGNNNMVQYREYSKYDKQELVGEEVIECIRMYYDKGITIYVAQDSIPQNIFNLTEYMNPAGNYAKRNYFKSASLQMYFTSVKKYRAYLVYNSENPQTKYNRMISSYTGYSQPTLQGKYNELDKCEGLPIQNSEVTAILIIDSNLL